MPLELDAFAAQDALEITWGAPTEAWWQPGKPAWGLALVSTGKSSWVAVSPLGLVLLARSLRPWHYHGPHRPNLAAVADRLAAALRHAEPEGETRHLFALPDGYGQCGAAVLLAHQSDENFPWIGRIKPTVAAAPEISEALWANPPRTPMRENIRAGSGMPSVADAATFLGEIDRLRRRVPPAAGESDADTRRSLAQAIGDERERLAVLRQLYPGLAADPRFQDQAWMHEPHLTVDRFLSEPAARSVPTPKAEAAPATSTTPPASPVLPPRRPTEVPTPRVRGTGSGL